MLLLLVTYSNIVIIFYICQYSVIIFFEEEVVAQPAGYQGTPDGKDFLYNRYTINLYYFPKLCWLFFWEYVFIIVYLIC
jgi:hypothetical protein